MRRPIHSGLTAIVNRLTKNAALTTRYVNANETFAAHSPVDKFARSHKTWRNIRRRIFDRLSSLIQRCSDRWQQRQILWKQPPELHQLVLFEDISCSLPLMIVVDGARRELFRAAEDGNCSLKNCDEQDSRFRFEREPKSKGSAFWLTP